jgi:hypothetical protein
MMFVDIALLRKPAVRMKTILAKAIVMRCGSKSSTFFAATIVLIL